jgi:hypothetical protein
MDEGQAIEGAPDVPGTDVRLPSTKKNDVPLSIGWCRFGSPNGLIHEADGPPGGDEP